MWRGKEQYHGKKDEYRVSDVFADLQAFFINRHINGHIGLPDVQHTDHVLQEPDVPSLKNPDRSDKELQTGIQCS